MEESKPIMTFSGKRTIILKMDGISSVIFTIETHQLMSRSASVAFPIKPSAPIIFAIQKGVKVSGGARYECISLSLSLVVKHIASNGSLELPVRSFGKRWNDNI